jgi:uncharacterized membrane-anchored protein
VSRFRALAIAIVVQIVIILVVAGPWLMARLTGDEYRLQVEPVDPRDPFRGSYVDLRLRGVPAYSERRGRAYVALRRNADGTYRGSGTRADKPAKGPFLRCNVSGDSDVECGIESFFASADEAQRLQQVLGRRGAIAHVKIDGAGRAALVDLKARPEN